PKVRRTICIASKQGQSVTAELAERRTPRYMSSVFALDRGVLPRVAWVLLVACAPTMKTPDEPPAAAPGVVNKLSPAPSGRDVMVGEMCPQGAGGRPAVA